MAHSYIDHIRIDNNTYFIGGWALSDNNEPATGFDYSKKKKRHSLDFVPVERKDLAKKSGSSALMSGFEVALTESEADSFFLDNSADVLANFADNSNLALTAPKNIKDYIASKSQGLFDKSITAFIELDFQRLAAYLLLAEKVGTTLQLDSPVLVEKAIAAIQFSRTDLKTAAPLLNKLKLQIDHNRPDPAYSVPALRLELLYSAGKQALANLSALPTPTTSQDVYPVFSHSVRLLHDFHLSDETADSLSDYMAYSWTNYKLLADLLGKMTLEELECYDRLCFVAQLLYRMFWLKSGEEAVKIKEHELAGVQRKLFISGLGAISPDQLKWLQVKSK
ncbi:hypothetical protein [Methylobacillus flagellatus]|uniref:hypothetical protein n=1 Tax=Methylobacillus flagellatus TaxID=405 RepID=UPI0010FA03F4|nr:hypothetical protein [Methylobacillus flagellatus]